MYNDFLIDIIKGYEKESTDYNSLSKLILDLWLTSKIKVNESDKEFEKDLISAIEQLEDHLKEDEDLVQLLFMFGYKKREDNRLEIIGFNNRLQQHYGLEFYYMELIELLSRELGTLFYEYVQNKTSVTKIEELLLFQHVRSCSIYSEVIHLIKGGFGTGALTRFRSLHELSVITDFIAENGDEAAESYFDFLPVMQKKDILFEEKVTGNSVVDEDYHKELDDILSEIEKRRGRDFVNCKNFNDYIWAKDYLEKGQIPSFNQIRKSIKRNNGVKPYKIASNNIHSAPRSLNSSLGTISGEVSGGASNIGLSLPGTWATYEIIQMNRLLFSHHNEDKSVDLYQHIQVLVLFKMLTHLAGLLYENFPNKEELLMEDEVEENND